MNDSEHDARILDKDLGRAIEAGRLSAGGEHGLLPERRMGSAQSPKFPRFDNSGCGLALRGRRGSAGEGTRAEAVALPADRDWDALRRRVAGDVFTPNAADFADVRSALVWNKIKPDRSPDVIVRVKNEHDVVEAVNFARENGLKVVVRGGGHTWCGLAVRRRWHDHRSLGAQRIQDRRGEPNRRDPARDQQPRAGASAGRTRPGLSDRSLSDRQGRRLSLERRHVLEHGSLGTGVFERRGRGICHRRRQAGRGSATEHQDLYWAARGCGPGMFAVATRFHLKCYPLPRAIAASNYCYSLNDLKHAVDEVVTLGRQMPDKVELSIFLIKAPAELAAACSDHNGKMCMVAAVAFGMTAEESEAALAPLERGAMVTKALARTFNEPSSFERLAIASGETWPENHRNLCENQCSKARPSDMLMALRDKFVEAPSAKSVIVFCQSTGPRNLLEPHPELAFNGCHIVRRLVGHLG